jgi:formylglycine-generating enzyme
MNRYLMACLLLASCGGSTLPPAGQLVVHVGTDAPLPAAPGLPAPTVPPLFDRIRISVYEPRVGTPCAGCVGEFAIDSSLEQQGKISFGALLQTGVTGYIARIDMFRGAATVGGDPTPRATVTRFVALPPVGQDGIIHTGVFLSVDDVGKPQGSLMAPMPPSAGLPAYDKVGTWHGATRVPCTGSPKFGEACVPGGAYWMGNTRLSEQRAPDLADDPHLVVVSPFFYDITEVTVAAYRQSNLATLMANPNPNDPLKMVASDPVDPLGDTNVQDAQSFCTYTTNAGKNEQFALNCISWSKAREYCQSKGADLATEAQFEYAASGMTSSLYVWGDDPPSCADAVYGRGGIGFFGSSGNDCDQTGRTFGVLPSGNGALDKLTLSGAAIFDLVGNVSEWTADKWNRTTESCWTSPLLTDPLCTTVSAKDGDLQSIRGGAWPTTIGEIQSAQRNPKPGAARPQTGFRCARSAK